MFNYKEFARAVKAKGWAPKQRTDHWAIRSSPLSVNYYFTTGTIYVCGTKLGYHGTWRDAIKAAETLPKARMGKKDKRKSDTKKHRARLLLIDPRCNWCKVPLTIESSTLDHVIPLGRGGLHNRNNMVLACSNCNKKRADQMPELNPSKVEV